MATTPKAAPIKKSDRAKTTERLTPATTQAVLDQLSLNQALRDFEVANARVIDLTRRLTSLNEEVLELRARLARGHAGQTGTPGVERELFEARAEIAALRLQLGR